MSDSLHLGEHNTGKRHYVTLYNCQYCYISNTTAIVTIVISDMNSPIIVSFTLLFVFMFLIITVVVAILL